MGEFINNNSLWIVGVLVVGIAVMFAWEHRDSKRALAVIAAVLVVLASGYWTSRTGASDVQSIAEVDSVLALGLPVVVEVFSDSCTVCLASKRKVDALEDSLGASAVVLRIDLLEDVGKAVAQRYGVGITPTFIVFSRDGRERYRESGFPDTERLESEALAPG